MIRIPLLLHLAAALMAAALVSSARASVRCEAVFAPPRERALRGHEFKVVSVSDVFGEAPDFTFLGFGRPNVFLVTPNSKGISEKLAAKSLRLAPARVEPTGDLVQSGLLLKLNPETFPPRAREELYKAMEARHGERSWTCVNSVCTALHEAGITSGGRALKDEYFPLPLLERIMVDGLEWRGEKIEVQVFKTTVADIEVFKKEVRAAERGTLLRHGRRHWDRWILRARTLGAGAQKEWRALWQPLQAGAYALSETLIPTDLSVDRYLPTALTAYAKKEKSLKNMIKQRVLFAPSTVAVLRDRLHIDQAADALDLRPGKHNLVITGDRVLVMPLKGINGVFDWFMTKHVLMSGYSPDVRFAGEIWKDAGGVYHVNNASGTYRPETGDTARAVALLQALHPGRNFVESVTEVQ